MADKAKEIIDNLTTVNATNQTAVPITPEGQILAYSGLYLMAIVSILLGSFRSVAFVKKHQKENKKIENSIGFSDAKWFPITASAVLFGLYTIFKFDQVRPMLATAVQKVLPFLPKNMAKIVDVDAFFNVTNETVANRTGFADTFVNATGVRIPALNKENFGYFLLVFFCYEGVFAMAHLIKPLVSFLIHFVTRNRIRFFQNFHYQLLLARTKQEPSSDNRHLANRKPSDKRDDPASDDYDIADWRWDRHDVFSVLLCSSIGFLHVAKGHWLTNNMFGMAFCLYGIEALHLSSFKGGVMLLAGLFVYDIFWVFATDVMSTVATSVKAPILLMFPQDILINGFKASKFAMLGLGDIVIPGIFLALLLRYGEHKKQRCYFYTTLAAYGAGLLLTIGVMHYFKAAQPALLYLVPTCVGAPCILALIKGDWRNLVSYSEEHLVKKDDDEKQKKKKDKENKVETRHVNNDTDSDGPAAAKKEKGKKSKEKETKKHK